MGGWVGGRVGLYLVVPEQFFLAQHEDATENELRDFGRVLWEVGGWVGGWMNG